MGIASRCKLSGCMRHPPHRQWWGFDFFQILVETCKHVKPYQFLASARCHTPNYIQNIETNSMTIILYIISYNHDKLKDHVARVRVITRWIWPLRDRGEFMLIPPYLCMVIPPFVSFWRGIWMHLVNLTTWSNLIKHDQTSSLSRRTLCGPATSAAGATWARTLWVRAVVATARNAPLERAPADRCFEGRDLGRKVV